MAKLALSQSAEPAATDGRARRSQRSRERIVEALFELVQEGALMPTGEQVAERAEVGLRSVFRHFDDMETLYAAMRERVERFAQPLLALTITDGSLLERIGALTRGRASLFERIAPFERAGRLRRWNSPLLQRSHDEMVAVLRANLKRVLPEMASLEPPLRQALELATSFEAWDRLRTEQQLSSERAQRALQSTVEAILHERD